MRMVGARIDLELAIHRVAHLGLRQHATHGLFHEPGRLTLPDVDRAFLAEAALEAAVPAIHLLILFAAGQLHGAGVHDDDVIARVDVWRVNRLVLALEQTRRHGRNPAQYLPVGIDDVPPAIRALGACYDRTHEKEIPRLHSIFR